MTRLTQRIRYRWFLHLIKSRRRHGRLKRIMKALCVAFLGIFKCIQRVKVGTTETEVTERGKVHLNMPWKFARLLTPIFDIRVGGRDGHPVINLKKRRNRG